MESKTDIKWTLIEYHKKTHLGISFFAYSLMSLLDVLGKDSEELKGVPADSLYPYLLVREQAELSTNLTMLIMKRLVMVELDIDQGVTLYRVTKVWSDLSNPNEKIYRTIRQ